MIKISIVTESKSAELYNILWKSIQDTLADYREDNDPTVDIVTTGTFSPKK